MDLDTSREMELEKGRKEREGTIEDIKGEKDNIQGGLAKSPSQPDREGES